MLSVRNRFAQLWYGLTAPYRAVHDFLFKAPAETSLADAAQVVWESPRDVLTHIESFRRHLAVALLVLAISTVIAFYYTGPILEFLARPVGGLDGFQVIEVTEPIGVYMRVSLLTGFVTSAPIIALIVFHFFAEGLMPHTRLTLLVAMPFAFGLFLAGMAFTYYVMLPAALPFLTGLLDVRFSPRPSNYIGFVTSLMFWVGTGFQFPLAVFALAYAGVLRADALIRHWRLWIVGIALFAAIVTPTVDPVNMALVMSPMILLYGFSVVLAALAQRLRPSRA